MRYFKFKNFGIFLIDVDKDAPITDIVSEHDKPYKGLNNVVGFIRIEEEGVFGPEKIIAEKKVVEVRRFMYKSEIGKLSEITELQFLEEFFRIKNYVLVIRPKLERGQFVSMSDNTKTIISQYDSNIFDYVHIPRPFIVGDCEVEIKPKRLPRKDDIIWEAPKTLGSLEFVPSESGWGDYVYRHPWRDLHFETVEDIIEFCKWDQKEKK